MSDPMNPEARINFVDVIDRALAILSAAETIKKTGGAVEIAGVRIEPCDERGETLTLKAFQDAAEARDRGRALADEWDTLPCVCGYRIPNGNDDSSQCLSCAAEDLRTSLDGTS